MQPGDVVVDRFEIERLAGVGGMGEVWRARDRLTDTVVALKRLTGGGDPSRFMREAALLADLRHPGIVRYVAHGVTPQDELYLAMEWLEGGDLSQRLLEGALGIPGTVTMLRRTASALAMAHARGIVHRDIKPSNLFLPSGSIDGIKVLDFGIARTDDVTRTRTQTGSILGSPGYMAPEQARGERDIDARVDVFALGCVTYECLTGKRAFDGDSLIAVLAKVLLEEAPRARDLVPDLPHALEKLLNRMLAKDAARRPESAAAIVADLAELGDLGLSESDNALEAARFSGRRRALTPGEQRMMGIVLAAPPKQAPRETGTITDGVLPDLERQEEIRLLVERHGATAAWLADGSLLATIGRRGAATDLAAQSARCALALHAAMPDRLIALTLARSEHSSRIGGDAIDHTTRILYADKSDTEAAVSARIVVDEITAGLLGNRFDIVIGKKGLILKGEREVADATRVLLGKKTTCVGREREIGSLDALLAECVEEPVARAVLVTAPPGVGKSRLSGEFVAGVRKRDEDSAVEIWIARADPMRTGSPFALIGEAVRHASGIAEGEPVESRREKLRARIARHVKEADRDRVTEFMGEVVGVPFPDEGRVQLRAARHDAMLMGDQVRSAWEDMIAAECAAHPLLLVLEDLHWGDVPTVKLVDAALRSSKERPLMVLALARPEVHDLFPKLWADRETQEIRLGALTRKSCERLVKQVLGDSVGPDVIAKIVERADGNAFYLEELIRTVADSSGGALPETIVAMVQARLEKLDPQARRLLRAASVFGRTFWKAGLGVLVGGETEPDQWLPDLTEQELINKQAQTRFPGEEEFGFRQSLVREGAYAMLTADDRTLGHGLAGDWLEKMGEVDAVLLAELFDRGGLPDRAVNWYPKAALHALEGNDLDGALARAERGVACGAAGAVLGELRLIQAEAQNWRGENEKAERLAKEAMTLLLKDTAPWYAAARETIINAAKAGHTDHVVEIAEELRSKPPEPGSLATWRMTLGWAAMNLMFGGRYDLAAEILDALDQVESVDSSDPRAEAVVAKARAIAAVIGGKPGAVELLESSLAGFEAAGDMRNASSTRTDLGFVCLELGDYAQAEVLLRQSLSDADRMGLLSVVPQVKQNLGVALMGTGKLAEAAAIQLEAAEALRAQGHPRMEGMCRMYLAMVQVRSQEFGTAETTAHQALALLEIAPGYRALTLSVLSSALLGLSKPVDALSPAREAMETLRSLGTLEEGESYVRLAFAKALLANSDTESANAALAEARDSLLVRAGKITDPARRASFLERVEENVQTLALARERLGQ